MPIVPDSKDWTWVLERPCPECGFDAGSVQALDVAALVKEATERWEAVLAGPGDLARRPQADRWSTLEYGCHVRDVFRIYDIRLHLMLDQDDPGFANWDQDATAVEERYHEQDPAAVSADLADAGLRLTASFAAIEPGQWSRTGTRSDGARFTVESFARYMVHDPIHHLHDVGQT